MKGKKVLTDCVDVVNVRQTFYKVNNLYDLFTNIAGDTILKFVQEINVYTKICCGLTNFSKYLFYTQPCL
jgi:hypothetical protein